MASFLQVRNPTSDLSPICAFYNGVIGLVASVHGLKQCLPLLFTLHFCKAPRNLIDALRTHQTFHCFYVLTVGRARSSSLDQQPFHYATLPGPAEPESLSAMGSKDAEYDAGKLGSQRNDIPTKKLLMTLLAISMGTVIECEWLSVWTLQCDYSYIAAPLMCKFQTVLEESLVAGFQSLALPSLHHLS